ncbi:MAG: 4Fe-4S binding protein [Verrucomicrobia bacterium]|jgi:ferredoxin|nr:4Fe-4S binding protein [Verrucomicrobiota bacterium]
MKNTDKSVDVYERLADALDALPAGFTRTPSKLEIKLIKLVFTPEEALVASTLSRKLETAAEIAERVGLPEDKVTALLEGMIPRRMVRADTLALETGVKGLGKVEAKPGQKPKAESVKRYRLSPFLVGWYESYLQESKPTNNEFARIYEQYVIEGGGEKIFAPRPGPQGVIPYRGSLKPEWLEREPHNDIDAHFQRHDRFLVLDCVCKKEKAALHGHSCYMPNKRCGFVGMPPVVPLSENVLSREEAIRLWNELDAMGTMIVEGFYGFTMGADAPQFVGGCHCCGCCCTILQGGRMGHVTETVERSNYRVVKDRDKCTNCGECVRRCQFFAHTSKAPDEKPVYHREKCVGCGACVMGCKFDALHLEPVSEEEWFHVPSSFTEWEEMRLEYLAAQK